MNAPIVITVTDSYRPVYQYVAFRESFGVAVWRSDTARRVAQIENIRCTDVRAVSAEHSTGSGYDSRCGYCWLGAGHTNDYHTAAIGRAAL